MKKYIIYLYIYYHKYFPISRGKYLISKVLNSFLGEVVVKTEGIYFEMIPNSSMDISYFSANQNESHNIVINEISKLKNNSVFIDIGANVGFFSFWAAKTIKGEGKIYCFEPSGREYRRLLMGIIKNKISNITAFNMGLGSEKGYLEFNVAKNHTGLNSFLPNNSQGQSVSVFTSTLDDIYIDTRKIDLIKLDVEGYEMQVLLGMKNLLKNKMVKKIIIEITSTSLEKVGYSKRYLYEFMKEHGYEAKYNLETWQYDEIFELK